jgi:tripeptidyl-peptidase-2
MIKLKCRFVAEYKCDLANYSFGEPINIANMGPALSAVQDLVEKYGVIYCASAGNDGPGIETVGAPGGIVPGVVSVGAYVSNDMLKVEHSVLGSGSSMLFTWSSRGPCLNGGHGVTVCAPGGAYASVPNWTQRGTQLMSGTSMSSPNCCGCISLILSGLKHERVEYNPYGVRRALQNTATIVDEPIGTGAGLVQVERAFDYLVEYKDSLLQKMSFEVKYVKKSQQMRGVYLKGQDELNETRDYLISIEPFFFENKTRTTDVPVEGGENDTNLLNGFFIFSFRFKAKLAVQSKQKSRKFIQKNFLFLIVDPKS